MRRPDDHGEWCDDGRDALPATFMSLAPGSWHPEVWHDVAWLASIGR